MTGDGEPLLTPEKRFRIVGLGDSTTAGTPGFRSPVEAPPDGEGDRKSQYSYWMMKRHPDWEVLNRGVNGERSDQVLARFQRDVLPAGPECVIILAGVNDVYQGFPNGFIMQNLDRMYGLVRAEGARLVAASVLPFNSMSESQAAAMEGLNNWIEARSSSLSASFCDTGAAVSDPANPGKLLDSPDGLHPGLEGYRLMGEALAQVLEGSSPG